MKHYFTSDWHLFGTNFLKNPARACFSSTEEMNERIVSNLLSTLKPGDNLYFLGDIGWRFPEGYLDNLFLKFKKHKLNFFWIEGNHDRSIHVESSCIKWRGQLKDIAVNSQKITLCHYPLLVWNASHYDAWSLFGHIHFKDNTWNILATLTDNAILQSKRLNVNVELHDFKPLEFEDVRTQFSTMPSRNLDLIEQPGYV